MLYINGEMPEKRKRPRAPKNAHWCGKDRLSESKAKCIVLAAPYRAGMEEQSYYCKRCKAWHTTSHPKSK